MREMLVTVGTLVLAAVHLLWYTRVVAYWLWEVSGGIREQGAWTAYGASDWAWTVPAQLPAGLLFRLDAGPAGVILLLAGSLAAGYGAAALAAGLVGGRRPRLGARTWRPWLALAGWAWVPVPAKLSWIYQWTVVY
jgi:hypothetical protein